MVKVQTMETKSLKLFATLIFIKTIIAESITCDQREQKYLAFFEKG